MLIPISIGLGTFSLSAQAWLWLLPVWLGLSLSIPLAWLTARRGAGEAARRAGLFLVAGEIEAREPGPILEESMSG